jgi:hypothetical protein
MTFNKNQPSLVFCVSHTDVRVNFFIKEILPELAKIGYQTLAVEHPATELKQTSSKDLQKILSYRVNEMKTLKEAAAQLAKKYQAAGNHYYDHKDQYESMMFLSELMAEHGLNIIKPYADPNHPEFRGKATPILTYSNQIKAQFELDAATKYGYKVFDIDIWGNAKSNKEAVMNYEINVASRENAISNNLLKLQQNYGKVVAIVGTLHCDNIKEKLIAATNNTTKNNIWLEDLLSSWLPSFFQTKEFDYKFIRLLDRDHIKDVYKIIGKPDLDVNIVKHYVEAETPSNPTDTVLCDLSIPAQGEWCKEWLLGATSPATHGGDEL